MKKGEQIPFDVAATRTIFVDHNDLDSAAQARRAIVDQIRELENDETEVIETPISVSIDLQLLRQSEKPEDRSLADILDSVTDIHALLGKLGLKIDGLENEENIELVRQDVRWLRRHMGEKAGSFGFSSDRGFRQFPPYMIHDFLSVMESRGFKNLSLLVMASICGEIMPWGRELAMEAYRHAGARSKSRAIRELEMLRDMMEVFRRYPWGSEILMGENEEAVRLLEHLIERAMHEMRD